MRNVLLTLVAIAGIGLGGCSSAATGGDTGTATAGDQPFTGAAIIAATANTAGPWRRDPIEIVSAVVRGDSLHLATRYGGGCRDHDFALVVTDAWRESHPVQVDVFLSHDARGDACRALISRDLAFSLTPIRDAYRQGYGAQSGVVALILDPGRLRLEYRF